MIPISASHAKLIRSLHQKKRRLAERLYLAEGARLLGELAAHPDLIEFVFGLEDKAGLLAENFPGEHCHILGYDRVDLFATDNPQGVGAVVRMPPPTTLADLPPHLPLLFLDAVADPGNLGAILRSADWFGMGGVLMGADCADPYNPKSVRATMGAIFRMMTIQDVTGQALAESERPLTAIDAGGDERLGSATLPLNGIFVVGSEAHGISPEIRGVCTRRISIGGAPNGTESLNAAMAASILCYELSLKRS